MTPMLSMGGLAMATWCGFCLMASAQTDPAALAPEALSVTCSVSGYEVLLKNAGTVPWPAGTTIEWSVRFAKMTGTHTVDRAIEPGAIVFLAAALGSSYLDSRKKCEATILEPPSGPA